MDPASRIPPTSTTLPETYHEFPAGEHDVGEEIADIPRPRTECGEDEPCERGAGDVPAAHLPALPDRGERVAKRGRNHDRSDRKADDVQVKVEGDAGGAAADGAIGTPGLGAAVVPPTKGPASAHSGSVDHEVRLRVAHNAIVSKTDAALIERCDGSCGWVARDPGDVAVCHSPVGGDEALLLASGPVRCRGHLCSDAQRKR